jgi:hypothetical protein
MAGREGNTRLHSPQRASYPKTVRFLPGKPGSSCLTLDLGTGRKGRRRSFTVNPTPPVLAAGCRKSHQELCTARLDQGPVTGVRPPGGLALCLGQGGRVGQDEGRRLVLWTLCPTCHCPKGYSWCAWCVWEVEAGVSRDPERGTLTLASPSPLPHTDSSRKQGTVGVMAWTGIAGVGGGIAALYPVLQATVGVLGLGKPEHTSWRDPTGHVCRLACRACNDTAGL